MNWEKEFLSQQAGTVEMIFYTKNSFRKGNLLSWFGAVDTNKINQIAKRVNQIGVIYKSDIGDIKKLLKSSQKSKELYIRCCWSGRSNLLDARIKFFQNYNKNAIIYKITS